MSVIADRVVAIHRSLSAAGLDHAFGGALALAWCTQDPRGTSDIDVNIFVSPKRAAAVAAALPQGVDCSPERIELLRRDGQVRFRWAETPVDVFLTTHPFHKQAASRARVEPFLGEAIPFLACGDLAVFKVFFNRTRDWADLEDMASAGTIEPASLRATVALLLGEDDERLRRLNDLPWKSRDSRPE